MRLTKRFIIKSLDNIPISQPIRYERYYINNSLRIQKRENCYEKEILTENNTLKQKEQISQEEFLKLKETAYKKIIRESYLYLKDDRDSIKKYYGDYTGLYRVEVKFLSKEEMKNYVKETWMGKEITLSPLAFDKDLSKLTPEEFLIELKKFL